MTLPTSGAISASQINVELSRASGAAFSLDGTAERGLAGVGSGAISFSSFHGKSSIIREPAQGEYYNDNTNWWLRIYNGSVTHANITWFGNHITGGDPPTATQFDFDGWRYFRGSYQGTVPGMDWNEQYNLYAIYRIKL